jgi:hypothetical protein
VKAERTDRDGKQTSQASTRGGNGASGSLTTQDGHDAHARNSASGCSRDDGALVEAIAALVAREPMPRGALKPEAAALYLGFSEDSFDRYVKAELPVIRVGTMRLYRIERLDEWLREHEEPSPAEDVR